VVGTIYTYALIKTLYDQGQDYIDSFWPFVVKVIPSNQSVTSSSIQRNLRRRFNLNVPLHVLELVLARAKTRNHIRKEKDELTSSMKYGLTKTGLNYSAKLETDREVDRRINALLDSIRKFFERKGVSISLNQIRRLLTYFLEKNIDLVVERINPAVSLNVRKPSQFRGYDRYLLMYIKSADQQEPYNYRTMEDMLMGSIISTLLYVKNPEEITKIRTRKFNHCQVFLDTNFVFSILDLHTKEFNEPAKELLNLLKRYNFDLKVFGFTVDEISRVISAYHRESYRYPISIHVNTLYSNLKRKGWTQRNARELIINLEQILQQQGITIEWIKDIDLDNYIADERLIDTIKKFKPDQSAFNRNHDLAAIAKITKLREKPMRRIEDSRAFFLTSDGRLTRFNFQEMGHKKNGTICETISDRLLTTILWLKNPNTTPPLKSLIAAHSRDLFVNRRVWDRFYEVLQKLKREGKIKVDDISTLFFHSYVEDSLRSIEETEADKITPEFVLEEIEKAERLREEEMEKKIKRIEKDKEEEMEMKLKKKEEEFLVSLEQTKSDIELKKDREWLDKIQQIKGNLREHSETNATMWSTIYTVLLSLAYIVVNIVAFFIIGVPLEILNLILTILGGGGVIGLIMFRSKLKQWLWERTYRLKLDEAKLDKIQ